MQTGRHEDHAARALDVLGPLIAAYNAANADGAIREEEIRLLREIIPLHSDKAAVTDHPYAELLRATFPNLSLALASVHVWESSSKDADALDRYLHGVATKEREMPRLLRVFGELGMEDPAFA